VFVSVACVAIAISVTLVVGLAIVSIILCVLCKRVTSLTLSLETGKSKQLPVAANYENATLPQHQQQQPQQKGANIVPTYINTFNTLPSRSPYYETVQPPADTDDNRGALYRN
jgi:hypothetical protein